MHIHVFVPTTTLASRSLPALVCACAGLRGAARAVTRAYDDALRPSGLRVTQFTLLQVLAIADEPVTQGTLGEFLALDSTTLSRTLRPLERRGWIRTLPAPDRRERHLALTPAGRRQFERARPRWQRAQERLRKRVGAAHWETLFETLDQVTRAARWRVVGSQVVQRSQLEQTYVTNKIGTEESRVRPAAPPCP